MVPDSPSVWLGRREVSAILGTEWGVESRAEWGGVSVERRGGGGGGNGGGGERFRQPVGEKFQVSDIRKMSILIFVLAKREWV